MLDPLPASIFAGMDVPTLQGMLAQAQQAYFKLSMGLTATEVVTQGDVVKFKATTPAQMEGLIFQLQAAIAGRQVGGAIGFDWSL